MIKILSQRTSQPEGEQKHFKNPRRKEVEEVQAVQEVLEVQVVHELQAVQEVL